MIILSIVGWITVWFFVVVFIWLAVLIWAIVDFAFIVSGKNEGQGRPSHRQVVAKRTSGQSRGG